MTTKASKDECCPVMRIVLERVKDSDRIGMSRELLFNFKTGAESSKIVLRFHKAPRGDKSEFANSTWAPVNFCPFCGSELTGSKVKRNRPRQHKTASGSA